ncbi:phage tailspike polysaccharide lyase family protein [Pseudomonas sp. 7-41]|uniref:phage tailspike polysaccharide lyase family protein n=1 Tax=Pseudomonas sp. 7-41 TaxID=2898483 RepID=UPI001E34D56F|nr:hypothetical protein [Pseudomonas sp. 7-41]UHG99207.1 hypothetical protein LQ249_07000 [Pseudomonas sp. 7-41]
MTVNTTESSALFATNGVTTNFPFYFKFLANEDLIVTYIDPQGVSTQLLFGTQYTANGAGSESGGSVVTSTALAGPGQLVVAREMDVLQLTSLRNQGKFLAEIHEDVFDRLTMLIQQGFSLFKRALIRPLGLDYFFAENRRITSVANPIGQQDAATKQSVETYLSSILATGQGPVNNAANVLYAPSLSGITTTVAAALDDLQRVTQGVAFVANPASFGAINDGTRHPLSDRFATLAAAQAVYPHATSLTNTIDWAAFQAALNTGLPVRYSRIPFINKELKAVPGNVSIAAEPGAFIDATASDFVGTNALSCTGSITQIASLASNVTAGSHVLPFATAHGLVSGDWICIWNPVGTSFSAFRSYYHAGEWVRVDKVLTSTSVNLAGNLYADYLAAGVQIYKLAKNDVTLIDVYVRSSTTVTNTIFLESITRLRTRGLRANALGEAGIVISKTPDGVLLDGSAFNPGTTGDDYGIITANSQNILVSGGQYHARRHGVAMGGYAGAGCVPCRNVIISEATITNDATSGVHAADMHGNSENCWFVNSHIRGGGTWQGKNNGYIGGSISAMDLGCVIYSSEMLGGNFTLDGVALSTFTNPQGTGRGIIDVGGQNNALTANTDGPVNLLVKNCTLNGKNLTNITFFLLFRNAGSVNKISVDINGMNFNVNNMGFVIRSALDSGTASSDGFSIQNLSGNLPQGVALHGASTGTYPTLPHRLPGLTYTQTVTTSTGASFVTGTPIAYRYTYPKVPAVVVSTSKITFIGSITPIAGADPDTETGFTPSIRTPNASNFTAAVPVKLNCKIGLSEF